MHYMIFPDFSDCARSALVLIEPFNILIVDGADLIYRRFYCSQQIRVWYPLPTGEYQVLDLGAPQHGDVVVFRYPENPKIYYIQTGDWRRWGYGEL